MVSREPRSNKFLLRPGNNQFQVLRLKSRRLLKGLKPAARALVRQAIEKSKRFVQAERGLSRNRRSPSVGVVINGHVDSISPASGLDFSLLPPDNATDNFVKIVQRIPVKIVVDEVGYIGSLRSGMFVESTFDTKGDVETLSWLRSQLEWRWTALVREESPGLVSREAFSLFLPLRAR